MVEKWEDIWLLGLLFTHILVSTDVLFAIRIRGANGYWQPQYGYRQPSTKHGSIWLAFVSFNFQLCAHNKYT